MAPLSRVILLTKLRLNVLPRRYLCAPQMPPTISSYNPHHHISLRSMGEISIFKSQIPIKSQFSKSQLFLVIGIWSFIGHWSLVIGHSASNVMRCGSEFGLFPFRSPLLRELTSFSFPPLTEMFHFSGFATSDEHWSSGVYHLTGFPIRKSPVQRLLDTSPRLIAVTPRPSSPPTPKASTIRP
jgi:hypothetical protein